MRHPFILFGPEHLLALATAFIAGPVLALWARGNWRRDRAVRFGFAALLVCGWIGWYVLFAVRGWLTLSNALPFNLCDWAAAALIVALLTANRFAYELGYFWGLGGTLQGVITPDIAFGFPDPQFLFFFIQHDGIIAGLLYLTLGTGLRPTLRSLLRVVAATFAYIAVAGTVDGLLKVDYGFLAGKPHNASLIDFLSPWPWYLPELVLIGLVSLLVYYAPFALSDWLRRRS